MFLGGNDLSSIVALVFSTVILALTGAYIVFRQAEKWGLLSSPNKRSSHERPTASGGGLGIVLASTVAGLWLSSAQSQGVLTTILLAAALAFVGLIDDLRHLSIKLRLLIQVTICAVLIVTLGKVPQMSFGDFLLSGWVMSMFVVLVGVWWINLFNFMDGIDGIAAAQAVFMLTMGAALITWENQDAMSSPIWSYMLCVSGAALGFLALNWPPAKIFMGDTGSTWLGFMIFALALLTIHAGWLSYEVWLVLGAVFVTDASVALLTRVASGKPWYKAHRDHAYQHLARRWQGEKNMGHRSVTLLVVAINMFWIAPLSWVSTQWPQVIWVCVGLAYTPLVIGALAIGAGRPERRSALQNS